MARSAVWSLRKRCGYLVWLWLREERTVWLEVIGGLVLFLYGMLPLLQPESASFGWVYAAYGGVFVALSLARGRWIEGMCPDGYELIGVGIILYAPR